MKVLFFGLTLLVSNAFAANQNQVAQLTIKDLVNLTSVEKDHKRCPGLHISREQKQAARDIIETTRADIKPLKPLAKKAKRNLKKVLFSEEATREELVVVAKEFKEAFKPIKKLHKKAILDISFDVLNGEQRVKLLKCKQRQMRRDNRGSI